VSYQQTASKKEERRNLFHGHKTKAAAFPTPRNEDKTRVEELDFIWEELDERKDRDERKK
jgi:hypothetical protein